MAKKFIKSVTLERIAEPGEPYEATMDYCSPSTLKMVKQSPLHYRDGERETSAALEFGKAYHALVLEPERFERMYFVPDEHAYIAKVMADALDNYEDLPKKPKSTKMYKRLVAEAQAAHGGTPITSADYKVMVDMKHVLMSHPKAKELLSDGLAERMHYCKVEAENGETYGVRFTPDNLKKKQYLNVDLKTAEDASVEAFSRSAAQYGYHIAAALTVDMLEAIYSFGLPYEFIFIVQEKKPPYAFNIFKASEEFIAQGRHEYQALMMLWGDAVKSGEFKGYQVWVQDKDDIVELDLPAYAIKNIDYFK